MEHNPTRLYKGPIGVLLEPAVRRARGHGWASSHLWVWKAHRLVWRATRSNRIVIDGHDYLLDPGDALALASGRYSPEEKTWYEANVQRGDTVVEAGANLGYFTLVLARIVGPEGRVISYEPDPDLAALLRRNVAHNGYQNVTVRQAACSNEAGTAKFYRSPVSTGDHRLFPHGKDDESFDVELVAMADDLASIGVSQVDIVKMDIQGAEPLAIEGLAECLRTAPPRQMLIEFMPSGMLGMGNDPVAMIDLIRSCGYDITIQDGYGITDADGQPFDVHVALEQLTLENEKWVNIVCTHRPSA